MDAISESRHADAVRSFVEEFNGRMSRTVKAPSRWVRFVPPVQADFDMVDRDPVLLPFARVGAVVDVWDVTNGFVSAQAGGWTLMYEAGEFLRTFVRAVDPSEWKPYPGRRTR
jgi:hypothetical protein